MPRQEDGQLVADVLARASASLYDFNKPFNQQSAAFYAARHREDVALYQARRVVEPASRTPGRTV